ncbi:AbrB/MazE/SpoVT family DNA-binding domain-containing protein [Paenibacillus dokdonensis]|uniref:AbrB/MazE/SpoVT family DNA-binding domain-containing protein n=1 Tax=Paenibacillus dokdonensis TaxID=2567944 RepID=UPI0010A7AF4F|nr:AbrB/MazE/SpoVT family DNA-binding domain-containing protein [Paenibacillus dokdonensis]
MKNIGIVRQVDELGRIVIPIELRRVLGVDEGDAVEFYVHKEAKYLMFRRLKSGCLFCGSIEALSYFKGQLICASCFRSMRRSEPNAAELESAIAMELREQRGTGSGGQQIMSQARAADEAAVRHEEEQQEEKKKRGKQVDTRKRLAKVMQTHPNASQVKWAEMIGVTQSYVTYLIRSAKKKSNAEECVGFFISQMAFSRKIRSLVIIQLL